MKRLIDFFREPLKFLRPDRSERALQYARDLWRAGPSEAAVSAFRKAIRCDPQNHLAYFDLGNVYQDRKEHRNAVAMFEAALKINPEFGHAYFTLGNAFVDLERYEDATKAYEKALYFSKGNYTPEDSANLFKFDVSTPVSVIPSVFDFKPFGLENLDRISKTALIPVQTKSQALLRLQTVQAEFNFPLMLIATRFVLDLCKAKQLHRVELCSRDCNLWRYIFEKLISTTDCGIEVNYFYTSRITRTRPSPTYLRYARERLKENTLVVDLCGTGESFTRLSEFLDLGKIDFFLLHKLTSKNKIYAEPKEKKVEIYHIFSEEPCLDNRKLEWANYADYPSCRDVEFSDDMFHPNFCDESRSADELFFVRTQRQIFLGAVDTLDQETFRELLNADYELLKDLVKTLYQKLSGSRELQIFELSFAIEESRILSQIRYFK